LRIATFLSTFGGSPLQGGIERGLMELGHQVCCYRPGMGYDLIIIFNQVAHRTDYRYPDFPTGDTPIAFVDAAEYGYWTRLPGRSQAFATSFTEYAMNHDTKVATEQARLKQFLEGRSFPYFIREMHNSIEYPEAFWPIDYPLYHLSRCDVRPDREEYLRRDLELFCWWGHSHPWRQHIETALRGANRKCEIGNRWSDENMPQDRYFERTRAAKCSVSFDGYGSGSFRMTEVLCRALLLMAPLSIRTRAPLVDGETCRMYEVQSDGEEFLGTNVAAVLADALADGEGSYEIYERGYDHCMTHLTERATAEYVLATVEAHDWSKPTSLAI